MTTEDTPPEGLDLADIAHNQNQRYGGNELPTAIAAFTGVAIGLGCPIHMLDRVWGVIVTQVMPRTPYECADQVRTAMRQCGLVC